MKKKTKAFLISIFGLFSMICSFTLTMNKANFKNVKADTGLENQVTVSINTFDDFGRATNTPILSLTTNGDGFVSTIDTIKSTFASNPSYKNIYKVGIDLLGDCNFPTINYANLPVELVLNLHGYTLTLSYLDAWKIYNGLSINGDNGTITVDMPTETPYSAMSLGAFWVREGDLHVDYVNISGCKNDIYPVFNVCAMDGLTTPRNVMFKNSKFLNCSSELYGGAICVANLKNLSLISCTFENCSSSYGGAIYINNSSETSDSTSIIVDRTKFKTCSATEGGAIYFKSKMLSAGYTCTSYFSSTNFENCSASENGGALLLKCNRFSWEFNDSNFTACSAIENGGAIYMLGDSNSILYAKITSCTAKFGGGVYQSGEIGCIQSCNISNCEASQQGGGVYTTNRSTLSLQDSSITNCRPSNSFGYGSFVSGGSVIIISIIAVVALATAGIFVGLYFRNKKRLVSK